MSAIYSGGSDENTLISIDSKPLLQTLHLRPDQCEEPLALLRFPADQAKADHVLPLPDIFSGHGKEANRVASFELSLRLVGDGLGDVRLLALALCNVRNGQAARCSQGFAMDNIPLGDPLPWHAAGGGGRLAEMCLNNRGWLNN